MEIGGKDTGKGGGGGGGGRRVCLAEESEEVQEEREEVEEYEEPREDKRDDFLSGTGGFGLPSPRDVVLGREETAGVSGKEDGGVGRREEKGETGEDGVRGEDTGVPGVGVLDWLE